MESLRSTQEEGSCFTLIAATEPGDDFGAGWKVCKVCGDEQPLDNFMVEKKGVGGRKAICKSCTSTRTPKNKVVVSNDRIQRALEAAAYRVIKESM